MMQHADAMGTGRTEAERESATLRSFYLAKLEELRVDPAPPALVNGHMIKALGFKPGPIFKVILEATFEAQLAGEFTDESGAQAWLSQHEAEFRTDSKCDPSPSSETGGGGKHCC
jgi:hypothetical protein